MMYSHPSAVIPTQVEHKGLPGVLLMVVSGPRVTPTGNIQYLVAMPDGKVVPVLKNNITPLGRGIKTLAQQKT